MAIAKPGTTLPHRQHTQQHLTVPTQSSSSSSATPSITSSALFSASTHEIAMLHDIHSLLDRIFIRNRNQHRRSTWWKALHGFRKQLALLLADFEAKGVRELERRQRVEARLKYWDDKGEVHSWYQYVFFSIHVFTYPPYSLCSRFLLEMLLHCFFSPHYKKKALLFELSSCHCPEYQC
jgi:hypothetical protein